MKLLVVLVSISTMFNQLWPGTELIVFSFDRSMQLYAFLESIESYTQGIEKCSILCRCSDRMHVKGYEVVANRFKDLNLHWYMQGQCPKEDFRPLLLKILEASTSSYVVFAVDDLIVTDKIVFKECEEILRRSPDVYAFYFRLGTNINQSNYGPMTLPVFQSLGKISDDEVLMWKLPPYSQNVHHWGYPHTVDMALFRRQHVIDAAQLISYHTPNSLEGDWSRYSAKLPYAVCFKHSKVVNVPANVVSQESSTMTFNQLSIKRMLFLFLNKQKKIDINAFHKMDNKDVHVCQPYTFIPR